MSLSLKVLHLISSAGFYGAENAIIQLAQALKPLRCETLVGAFHNSHRPNIEIVRRAEQYGLATRVFECKGRFDTNVITQIRNCLHKEGIHVLHTHGYKANFYGCRAARGTGLALVATAHNWPGKSLKLRLYAAFDRRLLLKFDHVCAVSKSVKDILESSGLPSSKVTLIENGIDIAQLSNGQPVLREELGLTHGPVIGFVGRIAKEKGLASLLACLSDILSRFRDAKVVLVGEGPDQEDLLRFARELHVEQHVVFLGKRIDMANVYASFDVFVLPSLGEGMPLAVLEAMAAGRPVVATRVGAIPTIVKDGQTGLLVEPGDNRELLSAICRLLDNPQMSNEFGRRGHELVTAQFSSERMAKSYLKTYQGVLSLRRAEPMSQRVAGVLSEGSEQ